MYLQKLILTGLVWGLVEFIVDAVAGAWVCKEA
jgi:hypothetical protein